MVNCADKESCVIDLNRYIDSKDPSCTASRARSYTQFECNLPESNIKQNYKTLRVNGSVALLAVVVYVAGVLIFERRMAIYKVRYNN